MWLSKCWYVVFWLAILFEHPFYLHRVVSEYVEIEWPFYWIREQLEEEVSFHFVKELCLSHIETVTELTSTTIEAQFGQVLHNVLPI